MSRPGITYQEVANAAVQLQGQNENPTVDRVREILNTGSKSTIARYLKEWKLKTGHVITSDTIPHELIAIVKGLWERLKSESNIQIAQCQQEAERLIDEIKKSLIQEQKNNYELQTKLHQVEENLHHEIQRSHDLKHLLEDEKRNNTKITERNERLSQQLLDHKTEIERLHQLLAHLQKNLEHYQNSVQTLREEQTLQIEKQRTTYEHKLSEQHQEIYHLKTEITKFESQLFFLNQQTELLQKDNFNLNAKVKQDEVNLAQLHFQCIQLQDENLNYKIKVDEQCNLIIDFEKKLAINLHQYVLLEKSSNEAADKIQVLREEKLFLSQEKSQLEGQLKKVEELLTTYVRNSAA